MRQVLDTFGEQYCTSLDVAAFDLLQVLCADPKVAADLEDLRERAVEPAPATTDRKCTTEVRHLSVVMITRARRPFYGPAGSGNAVVASSGAWKSTTCTR